MKAGGPEPDVEAAVRAVVFEVEHVPEELAPGAFRNVLGGVGVKQAHGDSPFGGAPAPGGRGLDSPDELHRVPG